jgi:hypothetical protein
MSAIHLVSTVIQWIEIHTYDELKSGEKNFFVFIPIRL